MRKLFLFLALAVGLLTSASTLQAQTVNMDSYITLTVADGAAIKLDFRAGTSGNRVRIVSGSNTQDITVNSGWYGTASYTADGTTMTVYGDLTDFDCKQNGANLTAIDPSHNTQLYELYCPSNQLTTLDLSNNTKLGKLNCSYNQLSSLNISKNTKLTRLDCSDNMLTNLNVSNNTKLTYLVCTNNMLSTLDLSHNTQLYNLYCYGNNFSTQALDDIYCSLPDRTHTYSGVIYPLNNASDPNHATVLATNKQSAIAKSWNLQYAQNATDIPATTGTYTCPHLNTSRYITLTVKKDSAIKLDFKAATAATPVCIVSGSNMVDIIVGTSWYGTAPYTAGITTMTIYGDLTDFDCSGNGANVIALNPSHNTLLKILYCYDNGISRLDMSQNTQLEQLYCKNNTIGSLDVLHNTKLKALDCAGNLLSSLDVSNNTQLKGLYCSYNYLSVLDVSNNIHLENLYCHGNSLRSLDISQNTQLKNLSCHGNDFTTATLDRIYCALPVRSASDGARIFPLGESSSVAEQSKVASTSGANAIAKNWRVLKYKEDGTHTDIATTGSYVCPEPNMSSYITLTVKSGEDITLNFQAAAEGTTIRIERGGRARDITVGTSLYGDTYFTAYGTEMKIYGDLTGFVCSSNRGKITALDPSHNTQLKWLSCSDNTLTSLDLSHNTQLEKLYCNKNQLTSLDLSHNTQLKQLFCDDNNFSTQALDDIYCTLPLRKASDLAVIYPIYSASSSYNDTVVATNAHNATDKNWSVLYYNSTDISTTGSYVCPAPTMDSYITLTVAKDSAIRLNLKAAADGTPVRIVSGGRTRYITVDTSLYGSAYYTAYGTEMKVYGDLTGFYCSGNRGKITALDPSHNTQLKWLYCSDNNLTTLNLSHNTQLRQLYCDGNNFSTQTLDDIYCTLPLRQASDLAVICPIYNTSSSNHATVLATNAQNATDKNWMVQYYSNDADIATTGSYVCGTPHTKPNMDRYITLTVAKDSAIKLDFKAAAAATPVRIVSGSNTQDITVGTDWYNGNIPSTYTVTAGSTTMTIYGDLTDFSCSGNYANLTAIDLSHNTQLQRLWCYSNQLTSLDVSKNTQLAYLSCYSNTLSSLDVSQNTELDWVNCSDNKLSSLDVSKNTKLWFLYCYGNNFSTAALDDIFCALPDRTGKDNGLIEPVKNSSDPNHATILATNAQNAIAKNWKVQYYDGNTDIPATTGKHKCSATTDIAEASAEPALTLYPNPVADVLYLSATARTIRVYDIYGTKVAHATDTDRVEVSHLPAGIYTVKADGTVAKMVKR